VSCGILSELYDDFNDLNLTDFDKISNDTQIASKLNHNQSINLKIYLYNFSLKVPIGAAVRAWATPIVILIFVIFFFIFKVLYEFI
jgi:ABC-type phosphate transport system permease subunit